MYDSGFETYRNVTPEEYRSVLQTGVVILDTNVLLNLYRYHSGTRKDLLEILDAIKDHLWIPHQVMHEFWQGRASVIGGRPKEIEGIISGIQDTRLQLDEEIRHWANRIGLPQGEKQKILDRIESTIGFVSNRIRTLSLTDAAHDAADTDHDPVLAALEPILDGSVGKPLSPQVARTATKEALQRIQDKRAPGWRDANKKENKEGDYFVWFQSLQEAKRRGVDVLLVQDEAKPDWWRIEQRQTKGPLPELVHEMREVANVRLFMTRPETLLLHAADVLGKNVSDDSILDVQRVSSQVDVRWGGGERAQSWREYENEVMEVIARLGYRVTENDPLSDSGFDLTVGNRDNHRVAFVEFKYRHRPIPVQVAHEIIGMATGSSSPVILIANVDLTQRAQDALERSAEDVRAITWAEDADTPQLAATLNEVFSNFTE